MDISQIEYKKQSIDDLKKFYNTDNSDIPADLQGLLDIQNQLREIKSKTIEFSRPIIYQKTISLIYPNTINVIQGKKGQHKSRLAENFCYELLKINNSIINPIGLSRNEDYKYTIVYIDTERNQKEQFPFALQNILLKSGYNIEDNPDDFQYLSLINIDRKERFNNIKTYIEHINNLHKDKQILIVLDVMTDCVENFNDPAKSMELIDSMNRLINESNVTFLCLIHENPSGDKARGHLGTEIINKATLVMQIAYEKDSQNNDTDLIKMSFLHCRNIKRPEPVYLRYSPEIKGLVLADSRFTFENTDKKNHKASIEELKPFFNKLINKRISSSVLINEISKELNCSAKTICTRLNNHIQNNYEFEYEDKLYLFCRDKVGKEIFYYLSDTIKKEPDEIPF